MFNPMCEFGLLSDIFKGEICSVCKICGENLDHIKPYFCMSMYGNRPMRFLKLLKNVIEAVILEERMVQTLSSFRGMCGMFCHKDLCPHYNKETCNTIKAKISCYTIFMSQRGVEFKGQQRELLINLYQAKDLSKVGGKLFDIINTSKLSKKKRKKIVKKIGKIRKRIASRTGINIYRGHGQNINTKYKKVKHTKPKPVTTTFFYNDNDPEWEKLIDKYLAN